MGRSKTRELLAEKAKYPYLLFLDADVLPVSTLFIAQYLQHASEKAVLVGGIRYESHQPESNRYFRWFYGKAREEISVGNRLKNPYNHFMTGNFLVPKSMSCHLVRRLLMYTKRRTTTTLVSLVKVHSPSSIN
jgi:hypothetical protein